MSQKSVSQIIGRALSDRAFRRLLQANPAKALAGYDLTADEVELVRSSLQTGRTSGPAGDLEPRVSRARLPLDALSGLMDSIAPDSQDVDLSGSNLAAEDAAATSAFAPPAPPHEAQVIVGGDEGATVIDALRAMVEGVTQERRGEGQALAGSRDSDVQAALAAAFARSRATSAGGGEAAPDQAGGLPADAESMPSGDLRAVLGDEAVPLQTDAAAAGLDNLPSEGDQPLGGVGDGLPGYGAPDGGLGGFGHGGESPGEGPLGGVEAPWSGGLPSGHGQGLPGGTGLGHGSGLGGTSSTQGGTSSGGGSSSGVGGMPHEFGPEHESGGGQSAEGVQQDFMDFCKDAYDSGDRPEGRNVSGWVAEKAAEFFGNRLDMGDSENAALVGILEQMAGMDTGENAPGIGVERITGDGTGAGDDGLFGDESEGEGVGDLFGDEDDGGEDQDDDSGGDDDGDDDTGGDDDSGDDDGGDDDDDGDDDDGGDDDGGDEDGGEEGYGAEGGEDDTGHRPSMPIGAGTASASGAGAGGQEEPDDSGRAPVILGGGAGSGGGEPGGDRDDSGHLAPILGGAVPERVIPPGMVPLYDPAESQADAPEVASPEAADAAGDAPIAGADNLRLSTDRGGELADDSETEAEG